MKLQYSISLLTLLLSAFFTSAIAETRQDELDAVKNFDEKYGGRKDNGKWSYDNDYTGQDEWGMINRTYAPCEIGRKQSPVQIAHTRKIALPTLEFKYSETSVTVRNLGYSIVLFFSDPQQTLQEGNRIYTLKTIEFHSPAEHTVRKRFYALEIQFTHENTEGERVTTSVFGLMDKPLPGIDALTSTIPSRGEERKMMLDPSVFLPAYHGYYSYEGSRTIPPCTENISWRILKSPIDISQKQLIALFNDVQRNARLNQPIYLREILEYIDPWKYSK